MTAKAVKKTTQDTHADQATEPEAVAGQDTGLPAAQTVEAGTGRPVVMTAAQGPVTPDGQHAVIQ